MYKLFKGKSEFCNKEFNRTYLSKHIVRCLINRFFIKRIHLNDNKNEMNDDNINLNNKIDKNHESDNNMFNRTLLLVLHFVVRLIYY